MDSTLYTNNITYHEDPVVEGQRKRVMTEKGLEYHLEHRLRFRQRADKELSKLSKDIEHLLSLNPDKNTVKHEYSNWLLVYEELLLSL